MFNYSKIQKIKPSQMNNFLIKNSLLDNIHKIID